MDKAKGPAPVQNDPKFDQDKVEKGEEQELRSAMRQADGRNKADGRNTAPKEDNDKQKEKNGEQKPS